MMMPTTRTSSMRVKALYRDSPRPAAREFVRRSPRRTPLECSGGTFFVICYSTFIISAGGGSRLLLQARDDADERREESKHDRPDDYSEEHNHNRFEHRGESGHRIINLVII